jgi:choline kinase
MKAVILAAGQGTRLRPLTNYLPKCLVQVHGKPLLQYTLESLDHIGIQHCVIVVGHLCEQVQHQFGSRFRDMLLTYVVNERYMLTNNLYSLWLTRHELDDDILLLECDLLFDEGLLDDVVKAPFPDVAVVDKFQPSMDGTVILAESGMARSMVLKSEQGTDFDYHNALKTVNIYKLCQPTMGHKFLPLMDRYVTQGLENLFYEAVMAELINGGKLRLSPLLSGARRWIEIDTEDDLHLAKKLFSWPSLEGAVL